VLGLYTVDVDALTDCEVCPRCLNVVASVVWSSRRRVERVVAVWRLFGSAVLRPAWTSDSLPQLHWSAAHVRRTAVPRTLVESGAVLQQWVLYRHR